MNTMPFKVLIAEDEVINRLYLKTLLEKWGHVVSEAANGSEAVEQYKKANPDIIFMDLNMPVMSGVEAARQIRDISSTGKKPLIIAVTAYETREYRDACDKVGMDGFIAKPVEEALLKEWLDRIN